MDEEDIEAYSLGPTHHEVTRQLQPGDHVNVMCALQIWAEALETVACEDIVESYSIAAEDCKCCGLSYESWWLE